MGQVMEPVFSCSDMCCNARKWWQWLALKWDGFISTKMGTVSWESCCFCAPRAVSAFQMHLSTSFHMETYFQGKTAHALMEFTIDMKISIKICLPYCGVLGFCAQVCKVKTPMRLREVVKLCMIHLYPDLQLAIIHNSGCECLCLSEAVHSSQFS